MVLLDPGVQYSVTCSGIQEQTLPDGRLEVVAHLRNRENRRIEVQANCVFKDQNGFSTGDETPFVMVILTENAHGRRALRLHEHPREEIHHPRAAGPLSGRGCPQRQRSGAGPGCATHRQSRPATD